MEELKKETTKEEDNSMEFNKKSNPPDNEAQDMTDTINKIKLEKQENQSNLSDSHASTDKPIITESQDVKTEEETFKKPVFVSRTQRQSIKNIKSKNDVDEQPGNSEDVGGSDKKLIISPAEQLLEKSVPVPYKEPSWSGLPPCNYSFEVLKTGSIVQEIPLTKPFIVLGRLQQCDIVMQHPSLSRYHCVVQYRAEGSSEQPCGFYAYDLGSTHGSFHNKHRMKAHTYYRLHVGHLLKLGGSTRTLILQGPEEDQEEETKETASELMAIAAERRKKLERLETGEIEEEDRDRKQKEDKEESMGGKQSDGIDWGMGEDAVDEENEEGGEARENPFASLNEEIYVTDPKKTLRGWMEREGYDLPEYETEDLGKGKYGCTVELPIPGPGGKPLVAQVEHKGRKKDAVVMCAREACRLLDKMGVLRQATHESLERRKRDWAENDYYDSDEDDFLDRTGDIQKKRHKRMEQAKRAPTTDTYETLSKKYEAVLEELETLEEKVLAAEALKSASSGASRGGETEDDLDSFMSCLKEEVPDKHKRVMWKLRIIELRKDELKLRKLTNIARPMGVKEIQPYQPKSEKHTTKPSQGGSIQGRLNKLNVGRHTNSSEAKEPKTYQVHKIFMEEEPENKVKLRRLDDDDDCDLPKPQPYMKKDMRKKDMRKWPRNEKKNIPDHLPFSSTNMQTSSFNTKIQSQTSKVESTCKTGDHIMEKVSNKSSLSSTDTDISQSHSVPISHTNTQSQTSSNTCIISQSNNISKQSQLPSNNTDMQTQSSSVKEKMEVDERKKDIEENTEERKNIEEDKEKLDEGKRKEKNIDDGNANKKKRIIGPTLPPNLASIGTNKDYKKVKRKIEKKPRYDEDDPNYVTWIPPKHQTGDGRTELNKKLGY